MAHIFFDPMLVVTGCPTLMVAPGHAGLPRTEFGKSSLVLRVNEGVSGYFLYPDTLSYLPQHSGNIHLKSPYFIVLKETLFCFFLRFRCVSRLCANISEQV